MVYIEDRSPPFDVSGYLPDGNSKEGGQDMQPSRVRLEDLVGYPALKRRIVELLQSAEDYKKAVQGVSVGTY